MNQALSTGHAISEFLITIMPAMYRITRNFGDKKIWRNLPKCYPLNFDELYFGDLQSWSTYDVTLSTTCDVCLALRG